MPPSFRTYYQVLGIAEDAPDEDVAAARRRLLKQVHPDLARDESDRLHREQLSRIVNDICDTLLDPVRRYDYDLRLARARRWAADGSPVAGSPVAGSPADGSPFAATGAAAAGPTEGPGPDGPWLDESEWFLDGAPGPHPIVIRVPALARLEPWLTWSVALLALVMVGVATVIYTTVGAQVLASIGLQFGRFGSLAVVLALAMLLVVLCLGVAHVARAASARMRGRARDT